MARDKYLEAAYPIVRMIRYKRGCYQLVRKSQIDGQQIKEARRGVIRKMSGKSVSRLIVTAQATDVVFTSMLTLTYPNIYPDNGQIVKTDIGVICQWIKRRWNADYLWFLEFQERGAPHIHVMLDLDEISPSMRVRLALHWAERVCCSDWFEYKHSLADPENYTVNIAKDSWRMVSVHSHTDQWSLIRSPSGARKYVTKYAAKQYQKKVPEKFQDVGRFWGCSQDVRPKEMHTIDVTDDEVRQYLQERDHTTADWDFLPKYLFNVNNGENVQ